MLHDSAYPKVRLTHALYIIVQGGQTLLDYDPCPHSHSRLIVVLSSLVLHYAFVMFSQLTSFLFMTSLIILDAIVVDYAHKRSPCCSCDVLPIVLSDHVECMLLFPLHQVDA